jgi:hypothetical protein
MQLFLYLLLAHALADFPFQPDRLVAMKRKGWAGLVIHVLIVTLITGALAWGKTPYWWLWTATVGVSHIATDQLRTFFLKDAGRKGLLYFLGDQAIHVVVIILSAALDEDWRTNSAGLFFESAVPLNSLWIVYLIALISLIWVMPILEAETTRVVVGPEEWMAWSKGVRIRLLDRLWGSFERLLAVGLILLGCLHPVPWVFLPRVYLQKEQWINSPHKRCFVVKLLTSFVSALLVGFILATVPVSLG